MSEPVMGKISAIPLTDCWTLTRLAARIAGDGTEAVILATKIVILSDASETSPVAATESAAMGASSALADAVPPTKLDVPFKIGETVDWTPLATADVAPFRSMPPKGFVTDPKVAPIGGSEAARLLTTAVVAGGVGVPASKGVSAPEAPVRLPPKRLTTELIEANGPLSGAVAPKMPDTPSKVVTLATAAVAVDRVLVIVL